VDPRTRAQPARRKRSGDNSLLHMGFIGSSERSVVVLPHQLVCVPPPREG